MTVRECTVVWLNAPGEIVLKTESLPAVRDKDILCETLVTAISPGTELAAFKGLPPLRPGVFFPRLLGYCNVARVLEIGSAVNDVQPGDRVLTFASHRSAFVIAEENILYKLPETARAEDIVCTYLFHLGYNAVLRGNVRVGSRVLVIGLGVIGLTTVALAALSGAKVFALSNQETPAVIARNFGAEAVFKREKLPALANALGDDLADVVVSTTNSWNDWTTALQMAGKLAVVSVLGFPGRGEPLPTINPLDSQYFYMKQLRIEAVGISPERPDSRGYCRFNERTNIEFLARQISNGRLDSAQLTSGVFDGTEIEQGYRRLLSREHSPITYLLKWNDA